MMPLPLADLEQLIQLPEYLADHQRDYRFTLEKQQTAVDRSLGAIKDVVSALRPAGTACPACGVPPAATGTVILSPDCIETKPALSAVEGNLGRA